MGTGATYPHALAKGPKKILGDFSNAIIASQDKSSGEEP